MTQPPLDPTPSDAARQALAAGPVPWDDLRERRVLAGIEASLDAPVASRPASPAPRASVVVALVAAVVAVAAVALLWLGLGSEPASLDDTPGLAMAEAPPVRAATPTIPDARPPTMALADGSVAQLHNGARVDVQVQTAEHVRLEQRSGTVRYEVARNPGRRFVVDAAGVEVTVVGTIFTVQYSGDSHVEVSVERGLVEVAASGRVAQLGAGDALTVAVQAEDEPDVVVMLDDEVTSPARPTDSRHAPRRSSKPAAPAPSGPTLEALLSESDSARAAGDLPRAAAALTQVTQRFSKDPQAAAAWFQLGNVQRRRTKHAAAAKAFANCHRRAPKGPLAEDARAESAAAWAQAGRSDKAAAAAAAYLSLHADGAHAARMRRILDPGE